MPARLPLDEAEIKRLYCEERLPAQMIADTLGCSKVPILIRLRKMGIVRSSRESQAISIEQGRNRNFKGYRISRNGYIEVLNRDHPRANKNGYVLEHILIWEQVHNRRLPKSYIIHHLNGIRDDNRPRNLKAMPRGEHHGYLVDQALKRRIRELEADVEILEKALRDHQLIFRISDD